MREGQRKAVFRALNAASGCGRQFVLVFAQPRPNNVSRSSASENLEYHMKEEFDKLVAAGKLGKHHIDSLLALTKSGFCLHRSWGFGRIMTVDTVFARFVIDFPN